MEIAGPRESGHEIFGRRADQNAPELVAANLSRSSSDALASQLAARQQRKAAATPTSPQLFAPPHCVWLAPCGK